MQVLPDWSKVLTAAAAEEQLVGFKFDGSGFYLTDQDTLLVVENSQKPTWKQRYSADTSFKVYCWNCPFSETVFGVDRRPPVRQDSRQTT